MRSLLAVILLAAALSGCGPAVRNTVSADYARVMPARVVILPLIWERRAASEADGISSLFRSMSADKLRHMNYQAVPLEEVEKAGGGSKDWSMGRTPNEIAALFGADSVLYIRIKDWDKVKFLAYASLGIKASFELYSATGALLWKAEYATREADLSLDSVPMRLAMHRAYEPRVQRFVDAVFSTLPPGQVRENPGKTYFRWLP